MIIIILNLILIISGNATNYAAIIILILNVP